EHGSARLLRVQLVQPEHAGPPRLGRPMRGEARLPVAGLTLRLRAKIARPIVARGRSDLLRGEPTARQPQPDLAFSFSGLRPGSGGPFDASGPASAPINVAMGPHEGAQVVVVGLSEGHARGTTDARSSTVAKVAPRSVERPSANPSPFCLPHA